MYLQLQPKLGGVAKVARQAEGRIGSDATPAAHDLIEPGSIDGKQLGQLVDAQVQGAPALPPV